jgi:hypothetical protein
MWTGDASTTTTTTTTTIDNTTMKQQTKLPMNKIFERMEQLAQINAGNFVQMSEGSKSTATEHVTRFINHNYAKYTGYLAMGHLISSIYLHPDPNLTLWNYFTTKREDIADEGQTVREDEFLPHVLNIVGFIENRHISSPKCISKHTILVYSPPARKKKKKSSSKEEPPAKKKKKKKSSESTSSASTSEEDQTKKKKKKKLASTDSEQDQQQETTKKKKHKKKHKSSSGVTKIREDENGYVLGSMSKKERDTIFGASRKFVKADACSTDGYPGSSFYELLHNTLLSMKVSALVQLHQDHFGVVSVVHDAENSGLVLSVLDEKPTTAAVQYSNITIPNEKLPVINSATVQAYPWLRDNMEHMMRYTAGQLVTKPIIEHQQKQHAQLQDQLELLREDVNMKIYNYNLKSSKTVVPFTKPQTLVTDFTKVHRMATTLPNKMELFIAEVEKVRYIGAVYMNASIIQSIVTLLNEVRNDKVIFVRESIERTDNDILAIVMLDYIIVQLQKHGESILKVPDLNLFMNTIHQKKQELFSNTMNE